MFLVRLLRNKFTIPIPLNLKGRKENSGGKETGKAFLNKITY